MDEEKRKILHAYILLKLDEYDYHAVSDAANDLREYEAIGDKMNKSQLKKISRRKNVIKKHNIEKNNKSKPKHKLDAESVEC